jgi:hypothetical protein
MFNTRPQAPWVPFTIPATPASPESGKKYALSFSDNAVSSKNPSQFLQWKNVGIKDGNAVGDVFYWNNEDWEILSPPPEESVLSSSGGSPSWYSLSQILNRIVELESSVAQIKSSVSQLESSVSQLESSVNSIESRLNSASISATCNNGNVVVTLNL